MVSTLEAVLAAALCAGAGFFLAAVWRHVYTASSALGEWIAGPPDAQRQRARRSIGFCVAFLCMLYTQAAFMVLALGFTEQVVSASPVHWPFWCVAFCVSLMPPWLARSYRSWCEGAPVRVRDVASAVIELIMIPLFFVLLYIPCSVRPWAWVPFSSRLF